MRIFVSGCDSAGCQEKPITSALASAVQNSFISQSCSYAMLFFPSRSPHLIAAVHDRRRLDSIVHKFIVDCLKRIVGPYEELINFGSFSFDYFLECLYGKKGSKCDRK